MRLGVTERLPVDGELDLTVSGVRPGTAVTVTATMRDPGGLRWRSEAEYTSGSDGTVAVARTAPGRGSYSGADGNGLLWSLRPEAEGAEAAWPPTGLEPLQVEFHAAAGRAAAATAQVTVQREAPGTSRRTVTDAGLRGTLFVPAGPGPFPPALVLGGSAGDANERTAAILAAHGHLALALFYFAAPGLPRELVDIELEYFGRALDWLRRQPEAAAGRTAVVGRSRGGEVALLLGLHLGVDIVVAIAASGIVNSGLRKGPDGWLSDAPSWRVGGRPLPYLSHARDLPAERDGVVSSTPAYLAALADWDAARAATMPLQDCRSAVLMISGTDDQIWPSALLSELALGRLRRRRDGRQRHLQLPGAGHLFLPPTLPATVLTLRYPQARQRLALGGTAAANARAGRLAHAAMLRALDGCIEDRDEEET
jgi:BAAT / Acyl-CoA thioester hydrolase C terminal/Acyl-CoA thioester hydrolase/BAAT N-terminal region